MTIEKAKIVIDKYEYGITLNALNNYRNYLLDNDKPTEYVDNLLYKLSKLPFKKDRYKRSI